MKSAISHIILFSALISSSLTKASDSTKTWAIGIETGIDYIQFQDEYASPLVYSGSGLPIILTAGYTTNRLMLNMQASAISSRINTAFKVGTDQETELTEWHDFQFSADIVFLMGENNHRFKHYLGGGIGGGYFYTAYEFLSGESWLGKANLFLDYAVAFHLADKHELMVDVELPLMAYLHRPLYTKDEQFYNDWLMDENILKYGKVKSISPAYFELTTGLSYRYKVSQHWRISAKIGYNYLYTSIPLPMKLSRSAAHIHLTYLF